MPNKYASGKHAIAECDRCYQRFKLKELKTQILKTKPYNIKVCPACYDPDHPQLHLGMYPVNDPQALREPRPDASYYASGVDASGNPSSGSRMIQWGWNPVGGAGANPPGNLLSSPANTQNSLVCTTYIGTVTAG